MNVRVASLVLVLASALAAKAPAQLFSTPLLKENAGRPDNGGLPPGLDGVGVKQKLDATPDLDAQFTDQDGKVLKIRDLFDGNKPVLFTFNFSDCPSVCSAQLQMLAGALKEIPLTAGKDFRLVTISLDHTESQDKALAGRTRYVKQVDREGMDWSFLRADEKNLLRFTDSVGYRFKWTGDANKIAHYPCIVFVTPKGKIARYIGGLNFFPTVLKMSIIEASEGKIGDLYSEVFLLCFNYDESTNSYVLFASNFMMLGGALTIAALGWFLWRMFRFEAGRGPGAGQAKVVNG